LRVTTRERCPICKRGDYCCRSANGEIVLCMRVESRRRSKNKMGGWIHLLTEPLPVVTARERPRAEPILDWNAEAKRMFDAGERERERLSGVLGVSLNALEQLLVGFGFDNYRHAEFSSWPEWNAAGKVVGIVRRYMDGAKRIMRGGHHGIYFGHLATEMPGPVFLPEGGSDTAALLSVGVNVVGRPSNTGGVDDLVRKLKFVRKPLVVIGERDRRATECGCGTCMQCWPGLAGANQTATALTERLKRKVAVKFFPSKDAREWLRANKTATPVDVFNTLYRPARDACRVCGNAPPHEHRRLPDRTEVICLECRALLENMKP
jgi:hypothetical protein